MVAASLSVTLCAFAPAVDVARSLAIDFAKSRALQQFGIADPSIAALPLTSPQSWEVKDVNSVQVFRDPLREKIGARRSRWLNHFVVTGSSKSRRCRGRMTGVQYQDDHVATGFGNHLTRPILRDEWNENLTFEEGVKFLEKCMRLLLYRDRSAVNKLRIAKITEKGVTISQPYSLKTFRDFATFKNLTLGAEGSW